MKHSIRTRFTSGMIFLLIIILVLSVFSSLLMNKISNKTRAILRENFVSVVYTREMSDGIMNISQEFSSGLLKNKKADSLKIIKEIGLIEKFLQLEKSNLTEPGEENLVEGFESDFKEYRDSVYMNLTTSETTERSLYLQAEAGDLYRQLVLLSQMNEKALEVKTDDVKAYTKRALTQMTILATICLLIGISFTFSFISYYNERFFQLYNGIKKSMSSNFDHKLDYAGRDEFHEISKMFNEMSEKLKDARQNISVTTPDDPGKGIDRKDIEELQQLLFNIKLLEDQAETLLVKFEKK